MAARDTNPNTVTPEGPSANQPATRNQKGLVDALGASDQLSANATKGDASQIIGENQGSGGSNSQSSGAATDTTPGNPVPTGPSAKQPATRNQKGLIDALGANLSDGATKGEASKRSTISSDILSTLDDIESAVETFFRAQSSAKQNEQALLLEQLDARLARQLTVSVQATEKQNQVAKLVADIRADHFERKENTIRAYALHGELSALVKVAEGDAERIQTSAKSRPSTDEILSLAKQLASFTSAPPAHRQGPLSIKNIDLRALLQASARLPYPSEQVMRSGLLGLLDTQKPGNVPLADQAGEIRSNTQDTMQARQQEQRPRNVQAHTAAPTNHEDFEFDLDLNPD